MSASNAAAIGTSVTLPAINNALGPTGAADPTTLSYSSGTLAVLPVAGASFYEFVLTDNSTGNQVAVLFSSASSVVLPSWLATELASRSIRVTIIVGDGSFGSDLCALTSVMNSDGCVPGTTMAIVDSIAGNNWKDITF